MSRFISGVCLILFVAIFQSNGIDIQNIKSLKNVAGELETRLFAFSQNAEIINLDARDNSAPVDVYAEDPSVDLAALKTTHDDVKHLLESLSSAIDFISTHVDQSLRWIYDHFRSSSKTFNVSTDQIDHTTKYIKTKYDKLKNSLIESNLLSMNRAELENNLSAMGSKSVVQELEDIFTAFNHPLPYGVDTLLRVMHEYSEHNNNERCDMGVSLHQKVWDFYCTLVLNELRGLVVMAHVYQIRTLILEKTEINENLKFIMNNHLKRINIYYLAFKRRMSSFDRDIRHCDHKSQVIELHGLVQSRILVANALGQCPLQCELYTASQVHEALKMPADIGIVEPTFLIQNSTVKLCKTGVSGYQSLLHTYHKTHDRCNLPGTYIDGIEEHTYSNIQNYETNMDGSTNFFQTNLPHCSVCGMYIFMTHLVHTHEQVSNIGQNMIVTGVKFEKVDGALVIRIKEGKLSEMGVVRDNEKWSEVQARSRELKHFDHKARGLYLEDTFVAAGYAVTGVRLKRDASDTGYKIVVRGTRYNFMSGHLYTNDTKWFENAPGHHLKNRIQIDVKDSVSTMSDQNTFSMKRGNLGVEFTAAAVDLTRENDVTLPYLTAEGVTMAKPMPINGVGLFFMKSEHSRGGGYVAPIIFTDSVDNYFK